MAKAIQLGTSAGLQINVRLLPPSAHHEDGLAWAEFSFCVSQQIIWGPDGSANASQPLQWTLVDLLHGLARTWPWLMFEEGYPLPLSPAPDHPGQLMDKAQLRWEDMPPTRSRSRRRPALRLQTAPRSVPSCAWNAAPAFVAAARRLRLCRMVARAEGHNTLAAPRNHANIDGAGRLSVHRST